MRYALLGCLLLAACDPQGIAAPGQVPLFSVASVTGTAGGSGQFRYTFTSPNAGDVSARITWPAKRNGGYTMNLRRLVNCQTWQGVTEEYVLQTVTPGAPPNGDWTLTAFGASPTAGPECWEVLFWPYSGGKVNLTLTVTTP